jgi:ornithine cyclodeaminase
VIPIDDTTIIRVSDVAALAREIGLALRSASHRRMSIPPRHVVVTADDRAFVSMPAVSIEHGVFVTKLATVFPRDASSPLPMVSATVIVFSTETGRLIATLDGIALTNLKCAAVSAYATDHCVPAGPISLAVLGAGVQARQQVRGVAAIRPLRELRLWARNTARREQLALELRSAYRDLPVTEHDSIEQAIDGADVVGTTTSATTPLSSFERLAATAHINAMGGHTDSSREVPEWVLRESLVVVEDLDTAINEAGAVHATAVELDALPRLGRDVLSRRRTIFSSTGHASLDALTTVHVLRRTGIVTGEEP